MPDLKELHTKLEDKNAEILKLVATSYGLGDVGSLEPSKLHQLEEEVEEIIEQHEEALLEGDTVEEWRALDERLAKTELGQLLQARFDICEQILDLQEDDPPEGAEMTDEDFHALIIDLIESHVDEEDRQLVLDWVMARTVAFDFMAKHGILTLDYWAKMGLKMPK